MGFTVREPPGSRERPPTLLCCVVPRGLAEIEPRLSRHFAADPKVEVVVDRRFEERRSHEPEDDAGVPGTADRRATDGRRTALPAHPKPRLPTQLRHFQRDIDFREVEARGWRWRCLAAEARASDLAETLTALTDSMRSPRGLSPRRFLGLVRAERSLDRYRRWRAGSGSSDPLER